MYCFKHNFFEINNFMICLWLLVVVTVTRLIKKTTLCYISCESVKNNPKLHGYSVPVSKSTQSVLILHPKALINLPYLFLWWPEQILTCKLFHYFVRKLSSQLQLYIILSYRKYSNKWININYKHHMGLLHTVPSSIIGDWFIKWAWCFGIWSVEWKLEIMMVWYAEFI